MTPPEGYRKLPKGVRCKCPALWQEVEADRLVYWCCNPQWLRELEHELHEEEKQALAVSNGWDFT